jgi:cytochrome c biogenesis factor
LSLLGTFLVRSGVLTSVHAFATDPTRGVFILLILCLFIGGSLALMPGASALKQGGLFAPISREGAGAQQSVPHHGLRDGVHRHALSAGAGSSDR